MIEMCSLDLSLIYLLYMSAPLVCYCCCSLPLATPPLAGCWYCQQRLAPGGLTHFSCARACHIYLFRLGSPRRSQHSAHFPFFLFAVAATAVAVTCVPLIQTVCNCVDVSFPLSEPLYSQSVFHFPFP